MSIMTSNLTCQATTNLSTGDGLFNFAALCHDVGHLPFSHAAEHELLPNGWNHERLTYDLIMSREMHDILMNSVPPVRPDHVAKIAIGPKKLSEFDLDVVFTDWETLLSEIVVGDHSE